MNNLSWFIYLTQAVENAGMFFSGAGIATIVWGIARFCYACAASDAAKYEYTMRDDAARVEAKNNAFKKLAPRAAPFIITAAAMFAIAAALPSRQTMLLIAGSEMGERIVKSDAVKDIVNPGADLLKAWIKDETDKITGKKK